MRIAKTRIVSTLLGLALAAAPAPRAEAALQLNEFLAGPARDWDGNGSFSARDDEWIEVFNSGATELDLGGYLLTDAERIPRYGFSGTLGPGGRRLVFGRDAYDWERAHGFPAFGLSLNNAGDTVMLWQVVGSDTLLVDSYVYRSHEAGSDRAVGRAPDGAGWALFDGLNPYGGSTPPLGTGCLPSPGAPNSCLVTPASPVSWGKIKALYR